MAKQIENIGKEPRPGRAGGLGEKIEATLQRASASVFNAVKDRLVDILAAGLGLFLEVLEQALAPRLAPFIDDIDKERLPPSLRDYLGHLRNPSSQAEALGLGGMATSLGMGAASSALAPVFRMLNYGMDRKMHSARPDPAAAWLMHWRAGLGEDFVRDYAQDLGWYDELATAYREIVRPRLSPADLLSDELRHDRPLSIAGDELTKRGYTPAAIEAMRRLARLIPGPGDLISMAVREAWRDDVAAEWGYDADFPPEFAEWMEKLGDKDGWARKYWRAHWDLPGLSTVLEILHRVDEFTPEDLETFLRISDIPATWRSYIRQVAYVPLTRVDVRRMYAMGVLTREEVKRNYLDLGYDDLNAERMTEFTVRFETDEDRKATKTDILSGLSLGMLTEAEAAEWLGDIGYPADVAGYLVAREAAKVERKQVAAWVKHVGDLYTHREIDLSEAASRLNALGLASGEVQRYLEGWAIDLEAREKRPSRATLQGFFKQDVITEEEFVSGLRILGYQEKYITWYLRDVLADKEEEARRAEEKVREEQENIRKRKVKSDYQVAKSLLDVDISELRTAIAETQVALQERTLRYRRDLGIARKALTAAELKAQAERDIEDWQTLIGSNQEAILFLQEQIEGLQTEIAAIALQASPEIAEIEPERAKTLVLEREFRIETIQDEIAAARTGIAQYRDQIRVRRAKLQEDLDIVARIRTVEEIEADYVKDQAVLVSRLSKLRVNLTELREQKAILDVGYRKGLLS